MEFIPAKTILSGYREGTRWFGVNYNLNIYRGCCHGCIYCDSRSECYRVDDFDRVRAKKDALVILEGELKSKRRRGVAGTGAMSDPYNPFEKDLQLTRGALALLDAYGFGASVCTKSGLVVRDADVLAEIKKHSPVIAKITVTACSDALCKKIEPHAPVSSQRFEAIRKLTQRGIFAGVLLMPVLPFIEDSPENMLGIIRMAGEAGARFVYPAFGVTLRQNQRDWFLKKLDESFPGMKDRYIRQFGDSYYCISPMAGQLWQLLSRECEKRGIFYKMMDIIEAYQGPYQQKQLNFLEK